MALVIYNTLTRKKESFVPMQEGRVGMYLCGPTVYKPSHLGHAVGPVIFDTIKRYLTHRGYKVTWVLNVTDVEDKLISEANVQGISPQELAKRVTKDYLAAMKLLDVEGIDEMPKASEYIGEIIKTIEALIRKGFAYVSAGDVYFNVAKDDDYGKLSNRRTDEQEGQRELQSGEKRNAGDFALWKAAKPEEPEDVKYASPWGKGRPGWHIECSAMSQKILGDTFDIHGGGMDLIFPHHENEIAQSESATGKPFATYWMHHGLTRFNTKKVAKSDTSTEMQNALKRITLHNLLEELPPELVRFMILSTHYRRPIEFSDSEVESRRKGLDGFYRLFERIERIAGKSAYQSVQSIRSGTGSNLPEELSSLVADSGKRFEEAMDDDFNTAGALAVLFEFASAINRYVDAHGLESKANEKDKENLLLVVGRLIALAQLLGIFLRPQAKGKESDGHMGRAMEVLIHIRQHLRKKKDFESADLIRDLLAERKIVLEDRAEGTTWRVD